MHEAITALPMDQVHHLGTVLAHAFAHEPNFTYMLPEPSRRLAALPWFFQRIVVGLAHRYGQVNTTPTTAGGAVWLEPGAVIAPWAAVQAGVLTMPWRFGWRGFQRSLRWNTTLDTTRQRVAPARHWYLMALGVDPSQQKKGIGSRLLQPVLAQADRDGEPCYLETFTLRNVRFYEKHGFASVVSAVVVPDGPPFWAMVRVPQPAARAAVHAL